MGITKACSVRDDEIRLSLLQFVKKPNIHYKAMAAALENIGEQNNPEDLDLLLAIAKDDSKIGQHAIIRGGVLQGLANHRSLKAFEYLERQTKASFFRTMLHSSEKQAPREPEKALPLLIDALSVSALWQSSPEIKRRVTSYLVDLLRDTRREVKRAAIWALCDMEVALENSVSIYATKPTIPDQDWMFVERRLRTAREAAGEGRVKELVKTLEEVKKNGIYGYHCPHKLNILYPISRLRAVYGILNGFQRTRAIFPRYRVLRKRVLPVGVSI